MPASKAVALAGQAKVAGAAREPSAAPERLGAEALVVLRQIMRHGASEAARIAACNALLDRAYGKARVRPEAPEPPPATLVTVRFV